MKLLSGIIKTQKSYGGKKVTEKDLIVIDDEQMVEITHGSDLHPKHTEALNIIFEGRVPPAAIRTKPKGGKQIPFAAHDWCTRTLNSAFRQLWGYECLEYTVHIDGSVSSRNRLTVYFPLKNGRIWKRVVTEIGTFEAYIKTKDGEPVLDAFGNPVYTMNVADRVASSVSRGLAKCMLRAFNIGLEFIEAEQEWTPLSSYNLLIKIGKSKGVEKEEVDDICREANISGDELIDRWYEAYNLVYHHHDKQEELPEDLK